MLYAFGLKLSGRSSWQRQPGQCCSHDWKRSPVACNPYCQYYKCEYPECTHTHTFNSPLSGTTRVSRYQKGKTNLDFTEARDSEWQWQQLGHMQVCTLLQTDNHASTPPLSFLQAGCPSCRPTNSVKALKVHTIPLIERVATGMVYVCVCVGCVGFNEGEGGGVPAAWWSQWADAAQDDPRVGQVLQTAVRRILHLAVDRSDSLLLRLQHPGRLLRGRSRRQCACPSVCPSVCFR